MKSLFKSSAGELFFVNNHLAWIDVLRVVAIFQVILIHISAPIFFIEGLSKSYILAANFYDSFSRACVPIFFMISGYLLLGRQESVKDFLLKRFFRVGIPGLAWTAAYLIWQHKMYRDGSMSIFGIGFSMIKAVFIGDFTYHLWFIFVLMGLYLFIPILRILVYASPGILNYFLILWLIANPVYYLVFRFIGQPADPNVRILQAEGYVGYLILGYVLGKLTLSSRGKWTAIIIFFAGVTLLYAGTNALSTQAGQLDDYLYDYLGFPVITMSVSLFLLFKSWGNFFTGNWTFLVRHLSDASFGIYLIHVAIIEALHKGWFSFQIYSWMKPPIYMIPITGLAVFMISFVIVFAIKKIPVLKYAV